MLRCAELRQLFIDYFHEHAHRVVPSSSLVPHDDPSLLFTNAGMVPFKDYFLGISQAPSPRATSVQRCVRAGGKHNDLDNVGYTARHHTFFEMLGNFSFGDYFKREAIQFAWEFLTERLKIDSNKLWITVHHSDDEAASIWLDEINIAPERFTRCGDDDNFWSMGETGPCGPCSEIFYDHGPSVAGGPPGTPEADGDRYMEIWNLVFMQYQRDAQGNLSNLPKPSVDTGMGLERLATVMQGVHDNYHIDLFKSLLSEAGRLVGCQDIDNPSLRVIADHIRSTAFLIIDGVLPSNEGRGYVLRRIIRRACRHGHKLGMQQPFFSRLVPTLVAEMGMAYPELARGQDLVQSVLKEEEQQFARTLSQGMRLFEQDVASLSSGATIPGTTVFKLYDTYGFPVDLTSDIARERGLQVDLAGFEQAMQHQRSQSQQASSFSGTIDFKLPSGTQSEFVGYSQLHSDSQVLALAQVGALCNQLSAGQAGVVILKQTPFYAESGGQVGDQGYLSAAGMRFQVTGTQKQGDLILHLGRVLEGELTQGATLHAEVTQSTRLATALNHSATHLLHAALQEQLGNHVQQKGSLVTSDKLRFDFSHNKALTADELRAIEQRVNQVIRSNVAVVTDVMAAEAALASGAQALFGEKYGEEVRVLSMGDFSKELCGGTHVNATGDIGLFKITLETSIAAGVRRIEAITGEAALHACQETERLCHALGDELKCEQSQLLARMQQVLRKQRELEKQVASLQKELANNAVGSIDGIDINGVQVIAQDIPDADAKTLRDMVDQLKQGAKPSVVLLATVHDGKIQFVAGVSKQQSKTISAGELLQFVAAQVGGKGGGRPDLAQGGGTQVDKLPQALASVADWVKQRMMDN